ncbi:hypothetical protein [Actinoplanes sp. NPDC089786]|uniref:hypothetical protein n=1 Tax=Actinoplanes sp. NPDC089786 TaxID=3155185 RepID=UPI003434266C
MHPDLQDQFRLAVSDDPGADLGELARNAMTEGGRIRRRRRRVGVAGVAAGVVVAMAVAGAVSYASGPAEVAAPVAAEPVRMTLVASADCEPQVVTRDATDAVIVVGPETAPPPEPGRLAEAEKMAPKVQSALEGDARVQKMRLETREETFEKLKQEAAKFPDLGPLSIDSVLPMLRVRLADAAEYADFRAEYMARNDVLDVTGFICKPSAPIGGAL